MRMLRTMRNGQGNDSLLKPSGSLRPEAVLRASLMCGEMNFAHMASGWQIHIRGISRTKMRVKMATSELLRWRNFLRTDTGFTTWRATGGNGTPTGIFPSIMASLQLPVTWGATLTVRLQL